MTELSRRAVLKTATALAVGAAAGATAHGYAWERHALQLVRVSLPVSGLSPALDGLRVGFITDIHHSAYVGPEDVLRAIEVVQAEHPDLIVLGGDYVSYGDFRYVHPVADMLRALDAPLGVFGILGNHDDERTMTPALASRGIRMLVDSRAVVTFRGASLELAGIKFWTKEPGQIATVLRGAVDPVLLLAHDPRRIVEAAALDVPAVLSGHTHGGQIVLPIVGALAARKFPVAKGRLTRESSELYVSAGVGTVSIPVRINCPPEVAIVTLQARSVRSAAG